MNGKFYDPQSSGAKHLIYASKNKQHSKLSAIGRPQCIDVLRSALTIVLQVLTARPIDARSPIDFSSSASAIMHITTAAALAITIIGIPFAWAHVKLALASLFPVGKTVEVDELKLLPGAGTGLRV
jgi:hypothetical protein